MARRPRRQNKKKLDDLDRLDPVRQFTPFLSSNGHSLSLWLPIGAIVGGTEPQIIGATPGEGEVVWPDGWYFSDP